MIFYERGQHVTALRNQASIFTGQLHTVSLRSQRKRSNYRQPECNYVSITNLIRDKRKSTGICTQVLGQSKTAALRSDSILQR